MAAFQINDLLKNMPELCEQCDHPIPSGDQECNDEAGIAICESCFRQSIGIGGDA